jgi:hypothetical protein
MYFLYEIEMPEDWEPKNLDGEVSGFELWPVSQVVESICKRGGGEFRPAVILHMIEFLIRHGELQPDTTDNYAEICSALHMPRLCL